MTAAILAEVNTRHRRLRALELDARETCLERAVRPPAPAIFVILQQYHIVLSPLTRAVCTIVKPDDLTAPFLSIRTSFFRMNHSWDFYQERR